jgi:hypothetical protein
MFRFSFETVSMGKINQKDRKKFVVKMKNILRSFKLHHKSKDDFVVLTLI